MTLYTAIITVPKDTRPESPVAYTLEVEEDVITYVSVRFPSGCQLMVHTAAYIGEVQIIPRPFGSSFAGDGETIAYQELIELPYTPCPITIKAWSPGTRYDHRIVWRIVALPRWYALWWAALERFISVLRAVLGVREEWLR